MPEILNSVQSLQHFQNTLPTVIRLDNCRIKISLQFDDKDDWHDLVDIAAKDVFDEETNQTTKMNWMVLFAIAMCK